MLVVLRIGSPQRVGQFAADIRELKKPEPYKGKGIKYVGERIKALREAQDMSLEQVSKLAGIAIERLQDSQFDVVLTDLRMGGADGRPRRSPDAAAR